MVDVFGSLSTMFDSWLFNPLIWLTVIIVMFLFAGGIVYFRKRRKLKFPAGEIVDLGGNGKTCINFLGNHGAGWFGKKKVLFGLWDTGEGVMTTKDGDVIEEFSEEDFQEINGRRGVLFYRDPTRRLFFPVSRLNVKDKSAIVQIAPADFSDTALDIIKKAEVETSDRYDKLMQIVAIALLIGGIIIGLLLLTHAWGQSEERAAKILGDAGQACMQNAKTICQEVCSAATRATSNAP